MALKIVRNPDGTVKSQWWYGVYEVDGKRRVSNLDVKIEGRVPESIRGEGDKAFEASRIRAQAALDALLRQAHTTKTAKALVEKFYEIETGEQIKVPYVRDLIKTLGKLPRRHEVAATYEAHRQDILGRFVSFITATYPKASKLSQITPTLAEAFMAAENSRGISARTYNEVLMILRQTFRRLQSRIGLPTNPFGDIPGRDSDTVSREPFTPEELKAILEAAQNDDFIRPLITTAVCTAMRRGDCALLKWRDVNLAERFVTVKTSKTQKQISIPIFPLLYDELRRQQEKSVHSEASERGEYVFPAQAKMYQTNPDGLNWRLKRVLWNAGFVDAEAAERAKNGNDTARLILPPEETRLKGMDAIQRAGMTEDKRRTMSAIFTAYMDGKTTGAIATELNVSKGTVSGHLNETETMIGAAVIHRQEKPLPPVIRGVIHGEDNGNRLRKASVKGWHSFRTTWITLALTAGVPLELVKRMTGHATTEVVLEHYFRPGREQFRAALQTAMPKLLMNGTKSHNEMDEVRKIVSAMTPRSCKQDKERVLKLLGKTEH
ncbi:MAG: tyrosine-type recombinase/integrase [Kiritimatiellia bacterium]|nr:tyrosine-type recombinase/integrase [Kiritimatiellia bacterium]